MNSTSNSSIKRNVLKRTLISNVTHILALDRMLNRNLSKLVTRFIRFGEPFQARTNVFNESNQFINFR